MYQVERSDHDEHDNYGIFLDRDEAQKHADELQVIEERYMIRLFRREGYTEEYCKKQYCRKWYYVEEYELGKGLPSRVPSN